ncbi:hypothetical protein EVG20_g3359 [Dentipellis fragilis]|uniref:Uncharacterized protein n=1 Tax=Dentipellis fragilis TaxID=205917 RepID=A0A4Y9Z337_9AGAM|nr:hypothetical protein EVG20_g3359 [Dentipellis fragilis]
MSAGTGVDGRRGRTDVSRSPVACPENPVPGHCGFKRSRSTRHDPRHGRSDSTTSAPRQKNLQASGRHQLDDAASGPGERRTFHFNVDAQHQTSLPLRSYEGTRQDFPADPGVTS